MRPLSLAVMALLVLSWNAPMMNQPPPCGDGSPLTDLDHYELPVYRVSIIRYETCQLEGGDPFACPLYAWSFQRHAIPGDQTSIALADPGIGEVLGWEDVAACDLAWNCSDDCEAGA